MAPGRGGNKPLSEPMMIMFYNAIWRHSHTQLEATDLSQYVNTRRLGHYHICYKRDENL